MANDTFSALAHPVRREIIERLSEGSATVGEVTGDLGVSKPTISRHLRTLEEAGVVSRAIVGRNHRLALRSETLAEAEEWIESQRTRWERPRRESSTPGSSANVRGAAPVRGR